MYEYDPFQHCCPTMNKYLDPKTTEGELLIYNRDVRTYRFILHENEDKSGWYVPILYCPWCGKKVPKDLDQEWGETLEKEYGLTREARRDDSKIPEEFKTDEWWKKRGL